METRIGRLRNAWLRQPPVPPVGNGAAPAEWRRHVAAVLRYKWLVLTVTIVGTIAAMWGAHLLDPRYQGRAVLWVEVTDPRARAPESVVAGAGQLLGATGWVDLLQSHAVLDEVVRSERLYLTVETRQAAGAFSTLATEPTYRPGRYSLEVDKANGYTLSTDGRVVERGTLGGPVGATIGLSWTPPAGSLAPAQSIQFTLRSQYETARYLSKDLRVVTELGGNFLRLELEGSEPDAVANTVNAVARRFVEVATDLKRKKLGELARILSEQLERARQNLSGAEAALQSFRTRTAPLLLGGGMPGTPGARTTADPVLAAFIELRGTEEQLGRDRQALERLLETASDSTGLALDALMFIGSAQRSPDVSRAMQELTAKQAELRALLLRYTPEHAPVKRLLAEIHALRRSTLPGATRALVAELGAREVELRGRVTAASGDLRRIPTLAIEDARLRRDVETAEEVFTRIQQRYGEAQLAEVSSLADVRVLDYAAPPERPLGDAGAILVLLGILGSFGLGAAGAVMLQGLDATVQHPQQITGEFGLRILGALPHVKEGNGAMLAVDALRGVRMNVQHSYGAAGPVVLTVSSPSTGDGKSFVAMNLAASFADAGHNTLLVDGDIRRGRLHRALGSRRLPGLMDVLSGAAPLDAALHATGRPNLSFLSCGTRTRSGPEQLGSPAMAQLLVELRKRYDVISIDTPPLAAGIDPYVLGTLTGNMLVVLRLGVTDRALAAGRLEALARLPIRVLGSVLNGVRERDVYSYYAYVLEGYELHDEETAWAEEKVLRS